MYKPNGDILNIIHRPDHAVNESSSSAGGFGTWNIKPGLIRLKAFLCFYVAPGGSGVEGGVDDRCTGK